MRYEIIHIALLCVHRMAENPILLVLLRRVSSLVKTANNGGECLGHDLGLMVLSVTAVYPPHLSFPCKLLLS